MTSFATIIVTILMGIIPFVYFDYKYGIKNKYYIGLFWLLANILMIGMLVLSKTYNHFLEMIITNTVCSVFNFFVLRGDIVIKKTPKTLGIFGLFMFSSLFQFLVLPFLNYDVYNLTADQDLILSIFSNGVLVILLILIFFDSLKIDFKKIKGNFNAMADIGIKYWLAGLIIMMVTNTIIGFLTPAQTVNEDSVQEIIHSTKYLSLISIGLLGPFIEEMVFRKSFSEVFKNKYVFIFASGIIFGALHVVLTFNSLWDFLYIIPYSSLGIAFAAMYKKTDNIFTPMFMHMFHNTALTILSIVQLGVILW